MLIPFINNWAWFVLIISFLLICMSIGGGVDYRIKCGEKIWLFICSCMSILLILLSMLVAFTPKSYDYIEGVQGRYFIPIIPFILFLLSTIPYRISDKSRILFIYCINHILVFMYIIMIAVKWWFMVHLIDLFRNSVQLLIKNVR